MAIRFHNTLSGKVEEFIPLEASKVRIYNCGPTVYDYAHIGNYRTFVFQDILRRHLSARGYEVVQVMNLTDVDDKTIRNSQAAGLSLREYTDKYIKAFEIDRELLNLEPPEVVVRATEHIHEMVKLIQTLEAKGYAYRSEGSIYFRVSRSRITASSPRSIARACGPARAWIPTSTTRPTSAISCSGRPPRKANPSGKRLLALAGRAGTSSARRCR